MKNHETYQQAMTLADLPDETLTGLVEAVGEPLDDAVSVEFGGRRTGSRSSASATLSPLPGNGRSPSVSRRTSRTN